MDLYQAEWCPHSHRIRQRLTELGVDFCARQVAAASDERQELMEIAGTTAIPVLVAEDGMPYPGEDAIIEYLDRFHEPPDSLEHRAKAREEVPTFVEVREAA
jgi:glutathione S-transferase